MKFYFSVVTGLSVALLLAGCSSGGGGEGDGSNSSLQGSWADTCIANGNLYEQQTITISGSNFVQSQGFFTDAACTELAVAIEPAGTYADGESTEVDLGTQIEVDVTFTAQSETWYLSGDIEDFNAIQRCGISNWEAGVSFDVTNCEDAINGIPMPTTLYHLYLVSGDDLYFGEGGFSNSADTRPTELTATPEFSRQ